VSLNNTLVELLASPPYMGNLSLISPFIQFMFFFIELSIETYYFMGQKRDPNLLREEEDFPSEKDIYTPLKYSPLV